MKPGYGIVDKLAELFDELNPTEKELHDFLEHLGSGSFSDELLTWVEKNFAWTPSRKDGEDVVFDDFDIDWS